MNVSNAMLEMLEYIKIILDIKKKVNHSRSNNYSVFTAIRSETDEERTHRTFLYELLSPDGQHGMKDAFLNEFFKTVLGIENYAKFVRVYQEYPIDLMKDNFGRIDLCIETESAWYAIEIKIDAGDQDNQVERYYRFAKSKSDTSKVYYLTLNGRYPSEKSVGNLSEQDIVCLSFAKEINAWLISCADIANRKQAQDVVAVINQYRILLGKLCDEQQDDVFMDAVGKLINSSRDHYECAVAFEKGLVAVRTEKLRQLFYDIGNFLNTDGRLKKYAISSRDNDEIITLDNCIAKYYPSNTNTYPKLWFEIKRIKDIRIILNIEVERTLYYGVMFTDDNWNKIPINKEILRKAFGSNNHPWFDEVDKYKGKNWWIWLRYLPFKDSPINFRTCSGIYSKLYDHAEYQNILNAIISEIRDNLESILETGMPNNP